MNNYATQAIEQSGIIKNVVCSENGRKFLLKNDSGKNIIKLHVDGKLIKTGVRCDYAIDVEAGDTVYLIELKGSDKEHAFEQLLTTLDYFTKTYETKNYYCRAVFSRVKAPNLIGKFEKLLIRAVKEHKCKDYDTACVVYDKDIV